MQTQTTRLSTPRIIILVAGMCAVLLALMFSFRGQQKVMQTHLANGNALILPAARDIKPFTLVQTPEQKFTLANFQNHWTLLFFGFTHCAQVCPTTLDMLNKAYGPLHKKYQNLQVVLISLDPERDSLSTITHYTQSFNPDFIGATGTLVELRKLQSQLGIASVRQGSAGAAGNYQLQHTSSILLINPEGKWTGLFKYGLSPEQFIAAFSEVMTALYPKRFNFRS